MISDSYYCSLGIYQVTCTADYTIFAFSAANFHQILNVQRFLQQWIRSDAKICLENAIKILHKSDQILV